MMEADRMINATILQSDLDKEFSVVRNEFEIGENDPQEFLWKRYFLLRICGTTTGTVRLEVKKISKE
ncbi:hypothetical protein LDL59_14355 [Kaistella anthropi]|nr:hypothetical protein [Kaistella anthropi]